MRRPLLFTLLATLFCAAAMAQENAPGPILFSKKDGDRYLIHSMQPDGSGARLLPGQVDNVQVFPTWSPDGKRIAYTSGQQASQSELALRILSADGTGLRSVETNRRISGLASWSPDGSRMVLVAGDQGPEIYVADADGQNLRGFSAEGVRAIFPFWTRDGKRIGYTRFAQDEMRSELVLAPADGGNAEVITKVDGFAVGSAGAVSPDGKKLLYGVVDPMNKMAGYRIYDLENKGETFLDQYAVNTDSMPEIFPSAAWSPDGKSFLVSMPTETGIAIFRCSEDGKERTRLTPEDQVCTMPSWRR